MVNNENDKIFNSLFSLYMGEKRTVKRLLKKTVEFLIKEKDKEHVS